MREIKFRAWLKEGKKMVEVQNICFDTKDISYKEDIGLIRCEEFENIELMQFTGLYDKSGKEIYEGDIVEGFRRKAVVKIGHVHNDKNSIYGVFAEWVRYGLTEAQYIDKIDREDYVEVIGNIYENKELMENANSI